jgi:beta-galactosidase
MNNSCGDLERYWEAIRTHAGLQGGFIWDWADQALVQRLTDGTERLAYGGDFGDDPNDGTFCLNGLVAADRTPHPSLIEAKVVLQPVRFAWLGGGDVRITNEHDFTDLADVADIDWTLSIDGDVIEAGTWGRVALAPGASIEMTSPVHPFRVDGWQIAHLTVRCGDIALAQYELARSDIRTTLDAAASLPTRLALWRAPIDNETFGPRHADRWRDLDLSNAHERIDLRTDVEGALVTHEAVVPDDLDDIARVGVRIQLPAGVASVDWIGRGPHECYSDRRAGAIVGRWQTSIDEWGTTYVHPQANGNRTDVRSLRVLDARGQPIVCIDELADLDVTVSRWSDEELDAARHHEDLPASETTYVWIDVRHRGVGSGAVGPDVSAPHRIGSGTYRWSYRIHRP